MTDRTTVRAAAPGLPADTTRRRVLATLAGAGAALSLPKAARATPAGTPASEVAELTRLYEIAKLRSDKATAACRAADASDDYVAIAAAEAEFKAAWDEQEAPVRLLIVNLRSSDPAVLRLKARVYLDSMPYSDRRFGLDDTVVEAISREGPWEDAVAASVMRDLVLAMIGGAL